MWAGHFFDLRATSEFCSEKPLAFPATSWTWVPLRYLCRWSDGTTTDLVPSHVNPAAAIYLVAAVATRTWIIWRRGGQEKTG